MSPPPDSKIVVDKNLIMTCGINSLGSTVKEAKILRKTYIVGSQVETIASYLDYGTLEKTNKPDNRQWTVLYNRTNGAAAINFKIDDFTCQDSGQYRCVVVHTGGHGTHTTHKLFYFKCAEKAFRAAYKNKVTVEHQSFFTDRNDKTSIPNINQSTPPDRNDKTTIPNINQSTPPDRNDKTTIPNINQSFSPDRNDKTTFPNINQSTPPDRNDKTTIPKINQSFSPDRNDKTFISKSIPHQFLPSDHSDHTTPRYPFLSPDNSDQITRTPQFLPSDHIEKVRKTQLSHSVEMIAMCVGTVLGCLVASGLALFAYWKRFHIMSMLAFKVPSVEKTLHTTHCGCDLYVDAEKGKPHDVPSVEKTLHTTRSGSDLHVDAEKEKPHHDVPSVEKTLHTTCSGSDLHVDAEKGKPHDVPSVEKTLHTTCSGSDLHVDAEKGKPHDQ